MRRAATIMACHRTPFPSSTQVLPRRCPLGSRPSASRRRRGLSVTTQPHQCGTGSARRSTSTSTRLTSSEQASILVGFAEVCGLPGPLLVGVMPKTLSRNVVLPTGKHSNQLYHRKNHGVPRLEVIHLGSKAYEAELAKKEAVKSGTDELHSHITKHWTLEGQRTLGHVLYAPPISVDAGDGNFTENWALIELDRSKFDWNTFPGNAINLGTFLFTVI